MIEQSCIERVKDAANIKEVVEQYVTLKRDGAGYVGSCPFHNEKTPSFKVTPAKNMYKCFGCGASGDSIEFVMKRENVDYLTAIRKLADKYRITLEEVKEQPKNYVKPPQQVQPLTKNSLDYFLSRGIRMETLVAAKVTSDVKWMPKAKKEVEVICFNYYRGNEIVNVKYRSVSEKDFMMVTNAELIFYNINSTENAKHVIITEGEIDCLSLMQCGYTSVVSVPNGAAKGNMKLDYFGSAYDLFAGIDKVILFVDNDDNGRLLRDELVRRIGAEKCYIVTPPEGCKDANDVLVKLGADSVKAAIKSAQQVPIEGVYSMKDYYREVKEYYGSGYPGGMKLGISVLDEYISFMFGQITILTGIPGSGKSEFLDFISVNMAKVHKWVFAICSPENQPTSLHITKLMEKYTGLSFAKRYNDNDRISPIDFERAAAFVEAHYNFMDIDVIDMTMDGVLAKAGELVSRKGVNALIIDPWNYVEHKIAAGQSETQYTSECLSKIKSFAKRKQVHVFLVAHPTKIKKVNGKYEVPTLYDISGSAHFFNKTDNGITVYRDFATNIVQIHFQKIRYSWLGKIGMAELGYDVNRRQYTYGNINSQQPDLHTPIPDNPYAGISGYQSNPQKLPENFFNEP